MACLLTDNMLTQMLDQLSALVEQLADAADALYSIEIEQTFNEIKEQGLEGLGGVADLFSTDIADFQAAIDGNQAFNPSDIAAAGDQYTNLLGTLFAGGKAVVPQGGDPLEAFDSPFASCGSHTTAGGLVSGIVNQQLSKLQGAANAIRGTVGVLTGQEPGLPAAIFYDALKNYIVKSTAQNLLLKQIKDTIEEINEDLVKLEDDDYRVNHGVTLAAAIVELSTADNILRAQADNIARRAPLNVKGYDTAIERIEAVADLLCGIDVKDIVGGFLSENVIKITVRLVYLEELIKLLKKSDEETTQLQFNLSQFDKAFEGITFFDDAFLPVISMARCRLSVVMSDMQSTIDNNNLFTFVAKEKLWCLELKVLGAVLKSAKVFDVDLGDSPFSPSGVEDVMNELFEGVKTQDQVVSIDSILLTLDQYMTNVRYKLSYNVDPDPVIARGDLVIRLLDQRREENESFGLFVGNRSLSAEQGLGAALAVLGSFFGAIRGLAGVGSQFVDAFKNADMKAIFGDLTDQLVQSALELILNQINAQLALIGCSLSDIDNNSLKAYELVEDQARSDALFNDASAGFPEDALRETVQGDLARYDIDSV